MDGKDRRKDGQPDEARLRAGLNGKQLATITTMEQLGWTLRFVRRPMFQDPVPVMMDRTGERSAVIESDGHANGEHGLTLRD
jgi:hypothetical protein